MTHSSASLLAGPQFVKAGYAGDNIPKFTFPSMVGRPTLRAEEDVIGDVELKVRQSSSHAVGRSLGAAVS